MSAKGATKKRGAPSPEAPLTTDQQRGIASPKQIKEVAVRARQLAEAIDGVNPIILPGEVRELHDGVRDRLRLFEEALTPVSVAGWPSAMTARCLVYAHDVLLPRIQAWASTQPIEIDRGKVERFRKELVGLFEALNTDLLNNFHPPRRLIIDRSTGTAILDGEPFRAIDPKALGLLEYFHQLPPGQVRSPRKIIDEAIGFYDRKGIERALNKLPSPLRLLIKAQTGSGRWFEYPPL
jgi:hypothetical protein